MNKYKLSKISHITTATNKLDTAADTILDAKLYGRDNLVLNYLLNFQNINPVRQRSEYEYINYYNMEEEYAALQEKTGISCYTENEWKHGIEELLKARRSHRKFQGKVKKEDLFTVLSAVLKDNKNERGEYRRVYPSGGALYPIKILLYIAGVEGINDGIYLYENKENSLVLYGLELEEKDINFILNGQNIVLGESKILIMYVYDLLKNYIKYHDIALSLAFIEVGAISQMMQLLGSQYHLGYCDIGGFPKGRLEKKIKINSYNYHIIHMGVMGRVKNEVCD